MGVRISNWGMRSQIGGIVAIAVVALLALGAFHVDGRMRQDARLSEAATANHLADRVQRLEVALLQMRRAEKNFLMRLDPTQAARHGELRRTAESEIGRLVSDATAIGRADVTSRIEAARRGITAYGAAFDKLVEARTRLGLDPKSGLEGELRQGAHDIEKAVEGLADPRAQVTLLQLRRHEKDFMLRHDAKYVDDFKKRIAELRTLVTAAEVSPTVRSGLDKAIDVYQRGFAAWVEGDGQVRAREAEMATVHRDLEPALDELEATSDRLEAAAQAEAEATVAATERTILVALGAILLLLGGVAGLIGGSVARQICAMTRAMTRLADGDLTVEIPGGDKTNEIGRMSRAVAVFRDNARERQRLEALQANETARAEAERRRARLDLAAAFERDVGSVVTMVSSAATELEVAAQTLSASAEEASAQSTAVAGASEEASANVQTVAAATTELTSTVGEVGRQVHRSAEIAAKALNEAQATRTQVQGLADAADRIGSIVQLIQEIAAKTNLLALNATIEAARAGEAGRGFAIVAQEVKGLATQTAHATAEIGAQAQAIQGSTRHAADAIAVIGRTIGEMNGIAGSIAAAVEEQGATTREISRNLGEAARGAADVSCNIAGVSSAAESSSAASTQVLAAAGELAKQAEALRGAVSGFLADVRAA